MPRWMYDTGVQSGVPNSPLISPTSSFTARRSSLVVGDVLARGHRHLDQHDLPAQVRRPLQQPAERAQALRDALRVVEAVHGEEHAAAREAARGSALERVAASPGRSRSRPANSSGAMPMGSASSRDDAPRADHAVHAAVEAEHAQQRGAEVLQVGDGSGRPRRSAPEQAAQQLLAPRQDAEDLGGRERDVEEEADRAPTGAASRSSCGSSIRW